MLTLTILIAVMYLLGPGRGMWKRRRQQDSVPELKPVPQSCIAEGMFEGMKRDWYHRILINHSQVPAALAKERAYAEPIDEIERHIELWGQRDVHHTCDCGVLLGVWKQMVDPQY